MAFTYTETAKEAFGRHKVVYGSWTNNESTSGGRLTASSLGLTNIIFSHASHSGITSSSRCESSSGGLVITTGASVSCSGTFVVFGYD